MTARSRPWEIATDLEKAAKAVRDARVALVNIDESAWPEISKIRGIMEIDYSVSTALRALSDKYQAIADAEPDTASVEGIS